MRKHCTPISTCPLLPAKAEEFLPPYNKAACIVAHIVDHDLWGALSCRKPCNCDGPID